MAVPIGLGRQVQCMCCGTSCIIRLVMVMYLWTGTICASSKLHCQGPECRNSCTRSMETKEKVRLQAVAYHIASTYVHTFNAYICFYVSNKYTLPGLSASTRMTYHWCIASTPMSVWIHPKQAIIIHKRPANPAAKECDQQWVGK